MRVLFFAITINIFISLTSFGQAPATFKYQAILRNVIGEIRANESVDIEVIITETDETEVIYSEIHNVQTNPFGLINLEIGSKDETAFSNIDWGSANYSMTVEVDGQSMGTSEILSVPVALYAETAGSVDYANVTNTPSLATVATTGNYVDLSGTPTLATVATSGSYTDLSNTPTNLVTTSGNQTIGGTKTFSSAIVASAGVNANNQKLTNVGTPTANNDAANKAYVDNALDDYVDRLSGTIPLETETIIFNAYEGQIWLVSAHIAVYSAPTDFYYGSWIVYISRDYGSLGRRIVSLGSYNCTLSNDPATSSYMPITLEVGSVGGDTEAVWSAVRLR